MTGSATSIAAQRPGSVIQRGTEDNTAGRLAVKVINAGDLCGLDQPQSAAVEWVPVIMHRDFMGPIGIT